MISSCSTVNRTNQESITADNTGFLQWKNNCSRCHNIPSPAAYSDEQWDVIGAHMRVRAYLTGKETENIICFLKSIN